MPSLILRVAVRYLIPLLLMFSLFLLFRGHNEPGGGFVGGLVASAAFALYAISHDTELARQALRVQPRYLIGTGLLIAFSSGIIGLAAGHPFLTGMWNTTELPGIGKPGTPLLFDIGVYTVVIGVTTLIVFSLKESSEENEEGED